MPTISKLPAYCIAVTLLAMLSPNAHAQIAVSANDNKVKLEDGKVNVQPNPPADTVTIINLGVSPPKVIAELKAPSSVAGPPQNVAISPDGSIALVAASAKIDPNDPKKTTTDNKLTVINLKANPPAITATLDTGSGAMGVAFNPAGTLVLVANHGEGTLSIFTVAGGKLTAAGKIELGDAKSGPCAIAFLPDGKTALVTRDGDHRISVLAIDGDKVTDTKRVMTGGFRPYSIEVSPKGDIAAIGNQGANTGDIMPVNIVDLKGKAPRIVNTVNVGQYVESVAFSPDGNYLAVIPQNGSNIAPTHPFYNDHGLVVVFSVKGTDLTKVAEAKIGKWPQGVAWSPDGKTLLAQSMVDGALAVVSFDGKALKVTGEVKVGGGPEGLAISKR